METLTRQTEFSWIPHTQISSGRSLSGNRLMGALKYEVAETERESEAEPVDYAPVVEARDKQTSILDLGRGGTSSSRRGKSALTCVTWTTWQNHSGATDP